MNRPPLWDDDVGRLSRKGSFGQTTSEPALLLGGSWWGWHRWGRSDFPLFYAFFRIFYAFFRFSSFFFVFLRFSLLRFSSRFAFLRFLRLSSLFSSSPKGQGPQGQTTAIYCKDGEFHSDPVCTDPAQTFPVLLAAPSQIPGFPCQSMTLKILTSLSKEVRPFFLGDNSIWSFPSVSPPIAFGVFPLFLPLAITGFGGPEGHFGLAIIAFGAFQTEFSVHCLQILVSLRKKWNIGSLDSLFKEVTVFKGGSKRPARERAREPRRCPQRPNKVLEFHQKGSKGVGAQKSLLKIVNRHRFLGTKSV